MTAVIIANIALFITNIVCYFVALLEGACAQDGIQVTLTTPGV